MKKILLFLSASYLCNAADAELFTVDNLSNQAELIPAAAELWHTSTTPSDISIEDATLALKKHLSGSLPACLLALQNKTVIGMVRVESRADDFPWICSLKNGKELDVPVICGLTVAVSHRKKGIGERLAREALNLLKNLGQDKALFKVKEELKPVCLRKQCHLVSGPDETNHVIMMSTTK